MSIKTKTNFKLTATKILALTLIFVLNSLFIHAQDTSYYANGNIKEICYEINDTLSCQWFEEDGSGIKVPNIIDYISYLIPIQEDSMLDIRTITNPKPISETQLWKLSKLLGVKFIGMEEGQSFSIKINDTISSYFISALDFGEAEFFIYLNDSTFITLHYPPAIMTSPEILAVSFQDYDNNGRTDIAYIIRYVTGAGPKGSWDRYDSVILLNKNDGFHERFFSDISTISDLRKKFRSEWKGEK